VSCLCGDLGCPSCGPAQGADLAREAFVDSLCEKHPDLLDVLDDHPFIDEMIDACVSEGVRIEREGRAEAEWAARAGGTRPDGDDCPDVGAHGTGWELPTCRPKEDA